MSATMSNPKSEIEQAPARAEVRPARRPRRLTIAARGEPASWLMGAALILSVALIAGLLALVAYEGLRTFWPRPIEEVTLRSGETFLGMPIAEESYEPDAALAAELRAREGRGDLSPGSVDSDGRPRRRLYRVGNRDLDQQPFRWVNLVEVASGRRPEWAMLLERDAWGIWLGRPVGLLEQSERTVPAGASLIENEMIQSPEGPRKVERSVLSTAANGDRVVRERLWLAEGEAATWAAMRARTPEIRERAREIRRLSRGELGQNSERLEGIRREVRLAELRLVDAEGGGGSVTGLPWAAWAAIVAGVLAAGASFVALRRLIDRGTMGRRGDPWLRLARAFVGVVALAGVIAALAERPWVEPMTQERLADIRTAAEAERVEIETDGERILGQVRELERQNDALRLVVETPTTSGPRFAPMRSTLPDEPMRLAQLVRPVLANQLTFMGKLGVYLDRWRELLVEEPREVNTEGGVFPVIFGTVLMTILLSIIVVPLGVIAALYIREYARQGPLIAFVRIAVNNLAGVPSIVYGVFGLGFFCYTLGGYIDHGPEAAARSQRWEWWGMAAVLATVVMGAVALALLGRPVPGTPATTRQKAARAGMGLAWLVAVGLVVVLLGTTPYFTGFFRHYGAPVMGSRGLLWASLTLALLTLPVVIVATEEAISAVPRSMREGSYGCGASKWQTVRRIVLPGAMPGIMTGMILAMARGAGEVAPLMLVGAVKLAPELPVSGHFPFVHLERSFMHLGFHIYDLGFQSPDSEAAKPLVWTTTLILIGVVVLLNVVAIRIRSKLRAKLRGSQF